MLIYMKINAAQSEVRRRERRKKKVFNKVFCELCINESEIVLNKHKCEFKMCDNK